MRPWPWCATGAFPAAGAPHPVNWTGRPDMTNPPTMQRSRGQLATSYAPHSLFTFEGGSGACMALSASGNRNAELRPITQRMIGEQIQE